MERGRERDFVVLFYASYILHSFEMSGWIYLPDSWEWGMDPERRWV